MSLPSHRARSQAPSPPPEDKLIFTIGHSTRPIADFIALLVAHRVGRLLDVRTVPRSRHNPQFNAEALAASLRAARITYARLPELGGLRHARPDSINGAWRNASFRGFADYMQTPAFTAGLKKLIAIAQRPRRRAAPFTAIMCAEAVPWRCHRSLLADALLARGIAVRHIMTATSAPAAHVTPFACVEGRRVTYPASGAEPGANER